MAELDALGSGKVLGIQTDVTDPVACAELAASVIDAFGGIDVVCANAGIFPEHRWPR